MGSPAARVTDPHSCPLSDGPKRHKGGPILPPGKPTVLIGGLPAATVTDLCACRSVPDIIMQGARTVLINGLPAARQYDKTVHGGMITMGCPSVLIGGPVYEDLSLLQYKPEEEESLVELGLSMILDFTPVVGTLKGFGELFWGYDLVTGEKLSIFERLIGWVPIFGKLGRVVKNGKNGARILKKRKVVDKFLGKTEKIAIGSRAVQKFSRIPKATELRNWARGEGYELLSNKKGIETWGVKGEDGWRLKIKEPSSTPGISPDSQKWRYSARTKPGEYYNPVNGQKGSRGEYGHMDLDPN